MGILVRSNLWLSKCLSPAKGLDDPNGPWRVPEARIGGRCWVLLVSPSRWRRSPSSVPPSAPGTCQRGPRRDRVSSASASALVWHLACKRSPVCTRPFVVVCLGSTGLHRDGTWCVTQAGPESGGRRLSPAASQRCRWDWDALGGRFRDSATPCMAARQGRQVSRGDAVCDAVP